MSEQLLCPHGIPGGCGADVEGEVFAEPQDPGPLAKTLLSLPDVDDVIGEDGVKVGPVEVAVDSDFATEASVVVSGTIPGS